MNEQWYQMQPQEVAEECHTDLKQGLKHKDVRRFLRIFGENKIYPISKASFYDCIKRVVFDYTTILLILTALIASIFDHNSSAVLLAVLVVLHLLVLLAVYFRSQKVLEDMERYSLPVVRVIRNGRLYMVEQKKLVRGDLVFLGEGDIIPADIRLIATRRFVTQEDNLFATSNVTQKEANAPILGECEEAGQRNMVFASTLAVGGDAEGIVVETGKNTLVCRLKKNTPIISHEKIPVMAVLQKYSRIWSLAMIVVVFCLTALNLTIVGAKELFSSFLLGLSFAVSSMSEMFVPLASIVIACGIYGGIKHYKDVNSGFIIKKPIALDKLKDITCLIVPKEDVFTTKEFLAEIVCTANHTYKISDHTVQRKIDRATTYALLTTGQYGVRAVSDKEKYVRRTEEDISIVSMAKKLGIYNISLDSSYPLLDHIDRDGGSILFDTTLIRQGMEQFAVMRGAPLEILSRCNAYISGGKVLYLDERTRNKLVGIYSKMAKQTYHIVGIASKKSIYNNLKYPGALYQEMVFEGFVAFRIPFLRGVGQTIRKCRDAGIQVIMLSKNNEEANYYFARQIGIVKRRNQSVDGYTYSNLSSDMKRKNASYYRMYSAMTQKQICELITNLKREGHKIGFLGHGLMDLRMMQMSDVTFAQNITISTHAKNSIIPVNNDIVTASTADIYAHKGCEALKFASDVIVSDADSKGNGGFNALVEAISYAKLIDRNMINMIRYLLSSQIARLLIVLFSIVSGIGVMEPVQIIFSGLILDFFAVLIFAFERPEDEVLFNKNSAVKRLRKPKRELKYAIAYGVSWAATGILYSVLNVVFRLQLSDAELISGTFLLWCVLQMMVLLCYKRDCWLFRQGARFSGILIIYLLLQVEAFALFFLIPGFGGLFGVTAISAKGWELVLLLCILFIVPCELLKHFYHKTDVKKKNFTDIDEIATQETEISHKNDMNQRRHSSSIEFDTQVVHSRKTNHISVSAERTTRTMPFTHISAKAEESNDSDAKTKEFELDVKELYRLFLTLDESKNNEDNTDDHTKTVKTK